MNKDVRYPEGSKFKVEGDASAMWLQGYNVRVCTYAEVLKQPMRTDKKVLVRLDDVDHDSNVFAYIKKNALRKKD